MMQNSIDRGWIHRMIICSSCERASFDRLFVEDGYPEEVEMLYPEPIIVPQGLPAKVAREYRAALKERRRNPNGYGAMLGRVLDAVCSHRKIPVKDANRLIGLTNRLRLLIEQENLCPIARGAAGLRNVAAHADVGELEPGDVQYLEGLVKYVLDHIYVIPTVNRRAIETEKARRTAAKKP